MFSVSTTSSTSSSMKSSEQEIRCQKTLGVTTCISEWRTWRFSIFESQSPVQFGRSLDVLRDGEGALIDDSELALAGMPLRRPRGSLQLLRIGRRSNWRGVGLEAVGVPDHRHVIRVLREDEADAFTNSMMSTNWMKYP